MPKRESDGTAFAVRLLILARPTTHSVGGREEKEPKGDYWVEENTVTLAFHSERGAVPVETRSSWAT